jgi:hypothetical protein
VPQIANDSSKPKKRADARRNQGRIFAAAKTCFADESKSYGMEDKARRAGVASAFGNRSGLVEAVYCDMLDELAKAAANLSEDPRPWHALRAWLEAYVDQLIAKRSIIRELQPLFDQNAHLTEET